MTLQRVVIIGGGFAGLTAVQHLKKAAVDITLLDRRNYHLFQPLLYQVATGGLSPANIASPLRSVLRRQKNVRVLMAEAVDIDAAGKRVILADGAVPFDTLIVATGVRHQYFGHDDWEPQAPGLKSIEDATEIRRRILLAFEAAERESDPARRQAWMTFAVVGGGPTGVELAGTLGELAHRTLRRDFRNIDTTKVRIILLEGADRILTAFPPKLSERAIRSLARLGVSVRTRAEVTDVHPGGVTFRCGGQMESLDCKTVLWAAGVKASPLGALLAKSAGAELDRAGRVVVQPDLSVPNHPHISVIGDLASCKTADGKPVPGVAPAAMQQGRYVAGLIRARLQGKTVAPFRYRDKGNLATIGRHAAVADLHWITFWGFPAWMVWLLIHLFYIIVFENRILIMIQWAWNYFLRGRSARLITGEVPKKLVE